MSKRKGYFGLGWVISLVLAIIPVTSWICGGVERILRGHIIAGIFKGINSLSLTYSIKIFTFMQKQSVGY